MSKNQIVKLIIVVLIVAGVGLGFWANKTKGEQGYSVVYLTTKEVYVGKLKTFPDLQLTDGYILNTVPDATDPEKMNFQLTPMREALWSPKRIHLLKDNVIFYGPLMSDSSIVKTLAEQAQ